MCTVNRHFQGALEPRAKYLEPNTKSQILTWQDHLSSDNQYSLQLKNVQCNVVHYPS